MTLRIGIPDLVSPSYFPAIAAVELGILRDAGLDASIELVGPVARTYEALRDGTLDYAGGSAHAVLRVFKDWGDARLLGALSQNMYWFLVVRADIAAAPGDLGALRGLRIGAAPGPADGLEGMLRAVGLDPRTDVTIGPVPGGLGHGNSFGLMAAAALASGAVDAFWANGMGAEVAVRGGTGRILLDARRGDGPPGATDYTFPVLVTTRDKVDNHSAEAVAVTRALVQAQQALKRDPALATAAAQRLFPPTETALIAELVRRDTPFYDAAVSRQKVAAMSDFARGLGLTTAVPAYEDLVPALARAVW